MRETSQAHPHCVGTYRGRPNIDAQNNNNNNNQKKNQQLQAFENANSG